ncbi:MAG TPA: glycoside hydrolase family 3 C-terminal domain-containing protein [Candidatus Binatia bacterium]|nr:glycoside hydrolase family 3 C-terminal domain-containing protein [Candidatus Binatia bacterium]
MSLPSRLALLAALLTAAPAPALTPEGRCQAGVAAAGARYFDRSLAILTACRAAIARGRLPAGTDCLARSATTRRRAEAAAALTHRVRRACSETAAAALMPGGDCAGARTPAALAACVAGSHEADAEALIAAGAPAGELAAPALRCQDEAIRAVRRFALARLRAIQACKRHPPRRLPPGTDCAAAPRVAARIVGLGGRAARRILARCPAAALAGARFGFPCATPGDGGALAQCLLATATTAVDDAIAAEFRDGGFCGDGTAAVERRIDDLLRRMPLDEKIAQMHGDGRLAGPGPAAEAKLGIPGLRMIDGARGVGVAAGHATAFPVAMARGATWDTALEERVGEAIGAEARAKGMSVILAPVLNILRHPRWGRAQETYGEDTFHLGSMGVAFIRGAQNHVIASAKHFAANSIEDTRFNVDVSIDERSLREIYLPHFRRAVQQGHAGSVMSAYNAVNGQHCGENVHLLHDILKGDWGFPGFVESDWYLGTRSTVPSAVAGLDIEMPAGNYYAKPLADAVAAHQVSTATIDAAVRRILRAQLCFRLDTEPPEPDPTQIESPAHTDLALAVARESIVLLKNAGAALPLDRARVHRVAVVGPLAATANLGDHGSSTVVPSFALAPLDGIRAQAGPVTVAYVPSAALSASDQTTIAAADAAVVVAGLTFADEGEGQITVGDRKSLALPDGQDQLIAAVAAVNPRTIVVLEGSGAVTMPWVDDVAAILMAWYPGEEGGRAIADVLFGDVTPSGKLPVSFPRVEQDLPPFDDQSLAVTYGYYHGYRWLDRNATSALFPFGFGLSYTAFRYTNLTVAPTTLSPAGRVRVTADVTNTGAVGGDEIAQLYVSYEGSRVDRAVKDLEGFARAHLAPGETQTVAFDVRAQDLAFWDSAAGAFTVEPITYVVRVGPSSDALPLEGSFVIAPASGRQPPP